MSFYSWRPYVPVAQRKRQAADQAAKLAKKGQILSPIVIEGRTIARTFWGKSWCENLERYSDYANRLPRGRTYVRNGSVIDLKIARGEVTALVSGSSVYKVKIAIKPVSRTLWTALCKDCAGSIDSLVELLRGHFSTSVMERVCLPKKGLFPSPKDIQLACSCPDWADMCKHVAATLYGVGARLDHSPELLFVLRDVDHKELVSRAGNGAVFTKKPSSSKRIMDGGDVASIFGLEMEAGEEEKGLAPARSSSRKKATASSANTKRSVKSKSAANSSTEAPVTPPAKASAKTKVAVKAAGKPSAAAKTERKRGKSASSPAAEIPNSSKRSAGRQAATRSVSKTKATPAGRAGRRGTKAGRSTSKLPSA